MYMELDEKIESLANAVIGAAIEVHRILGPGYLESVYEEALSQEFKLRKIAFERQKIIDIHYKGWPIGEGRVDYLVENVLIVELKAIESFSPIHTSQVLSYLKMTNLQLGLLINFNVTSLRVGIKRIIKSK